jgi:hypothetical protein
MNNKGNEEKIENIECKNTEKKLIIVCRCQNCRSLVHSDISFGGTPLKYCWICRKRKLN